MIKRGWVAMSNFILDGIMGLAVADALGVPVEFESRDSLSKNPVVGVRAYGTYNQPAGTWSDDTSMTLALADSLARGLNYNDIMENFIKWYEYGEFTPHGEVFDVGIATTKALLRYKEGVFPLKCGGKNELDNGNGSLMRILPVVYYLQSVYGTDFQREDEVFEIIHNVSSLTHGHKRSLMACGIYISVVSMLLSGMNLETAVDSGVNRAMEYYRRRDNFKYEIKHFSRLEIRDFKNLPEYEIKSSGYVVSTLEAAIWSLLNTDDYKSCVLKAVNLGDDTDTVGAAAGGLAGIKYGYEAIPEEWKATLARREYIEKLCNHLYITLTRNSINKLLPYIPYFEAAAEESPCRWVGGEKTGENTYNVAYPEYDKKLMDFVDEFYKTNLVAYDYLDILNRNNLKNSEMIKCAIDTADVELLKAILTGYIRQERFNSGLWEEAVKEKVFLRILSRFKEITEYKY